MFNKKILGVSVVLILLAGFLFNACDDSGTNDGPNVEYDFIIENQTNTGYNIYLTANVEGESGFTKIGEVAALNQFRKHNLLINIPYECRLVKDGGSVDTPDYSKSFTHLLLTDYIWTVK